MQIARVVCKVRTTKEAIFDYAIGPEILPQVKFGILVLVPFHGRKIEGIIVDLKPASKIENLKPILKIIDCVPVIDEIHYQLAKWMADYYFAPLGKTLFLNVVPTATRTLSKTAEINFTDWNINKNLKKQTPKNCLIFADFISRLEFYRQEAAKTLAGGRSVIILIPDLTMLEFFRFSGAIQLHAGLSKTNRWLLWHKIRTSKKPIIVIGSQSALFAPLANLGLVIVDQEENPSFKNDRQPYFQASKTAIKLGEISKAKVIFGSACPLVESYFRALKKKYTIIKKDFQNRQKILIVDQNFSKNLISPALENGIRSNLAQKKKILLYLERKGEGIKYTCADCSWLFSCPNCNTPLVPDKIKTYCWRCQKKFIPPVKCPLCQGSNLKIVGATTGWLERKISALYPTAKIIKLENSNKVGSLNSNWDIAIVTSYALKFRFPPIGLVGIIDADLSVSFPDFRSTEKTFSKIYKFLKISKAGIIQTHLPHSAHISALAKLNYLNFYQNEIEVRRKFNFPPFVRLIRLLYRNLSREVSVKESQRVAELLKNKFAHDKTVFISDNSPAFFEQKNKNWYWQIIIKLAGKTPDELAGILANLPTLWRVDADPQEMI